MKQFGVTAGIKVGIVGIGGLGADVTAFTPTPAKAAVRYRSVTAPRRSARCAPSRGTDGCGAHFHDRRRTR